MMIYDRNVLAKADKRRDDRGVRVEGSRKSGNMMKPASAAATIVVDLCVAYPTRV